MSSEADDLHQLLRNWLSDSMRAYFETHRQPLPARVISWDDTTQRADVQPVIQLYIEGALVEAPVLRSVPVAFPGSAMGGLTYPLIPQSYVELVPQEADLSTWFSAGSLNLPPPTSRRLDLSDVIAWPLDPRPMTAPLGKTCLAPDGPVVWGQVVYLGGSDASDFAALASKVLSALQDLYLELAGHGHPTPAGPTSGYTPGGTITPPWAPDVASDVVRSK
jgi:hypothetical protein